MASIKTWTERFTWGAVVFVAASVASFGGWSTVQIYDRPTKTEVLHMLRSQSPYIEDRKLLMDWIDRSNVSDQRLVEMIQRNTDAINQLRVSIARIEKE